jgi:uncharacterized protein (TIGR03437 family)
MMGGLNPFHTLTNPQQVTNTLAGVHVLFAGVPAPLTYVSDKSK